MNACTEPELCIDISTEKEAKVEEIFADMKRCTRCILPESFPGIEFNEDGVCNYCLDYEPIKVLGEVALERILGRYRNNGSKYDCIVPISGGRDSAFVLHQMVRKYEMSVLALTVDSGAIMPEGIRNIERITEALNVDHVFLRDEKQIQTAKRNARTKFHGWLKRPSINTIVPVLNSADKMMNTRMQRYAKKNHIGLVLGGNIVGTSTIEHDHFKTGFLGVFPDEHGMYSASSKLRLLFLFGLEFFRDPVNLKASILKEYLGGIAGYFFESLLKPSAVQSLGFYDYVYWSEPEIVTTITKELGWKGASDTTATWRVDDAAYPLIDYIYLRLVGFNEFDELFSKMIREGQIQRDVALKRCLSENGPRISSLVDSFEELGVTKEQVDGVLEKYRVRLLDRLLHKRHL